MDHICTTSQKSSKRKKIIGKMRDCFADMIINLDKGASAEEIEKIKFRMRTKHSQLSETDIRRAENLIHLSDLLQKHRLVSYESVTNLKLYLKDSPNLVQIVDACEAKIGTLKKKKMNVSKKLKLKNKPLQRSIKEQTYTGSVFNEKTKIIIRTKDFDILVHNTGDLVAHFRKIIAAFVNISEERITDFEIKSGSVVIEFVIKGGEAFETSAHDLSMKIKNGITCGSLVLTDIENNPQAIELISIEVYSIWRYVQSEVDKIETSENLQQHFLSETAAYDSYAFNSSSSPKSDYLHSEMSTSGLSQTLNTASKREGSAEPDTSLMSERKGADTKVLLTETSLHRVSEAGALGFSDTDSDDEHSLTDFDLVDNTSMDVQKSGRSTFNNPPVLPSTVETLRKRKYRIGLNFFNMTPEKGIRFLQQNNFIDESPRVVARFLITRKGLSKERTGEYLFNTQNEYNMDVLNYFVKEIDLSGLVVDEALRKYQSHFRMPEEEEKIKTMTDLFASRFTYCNPDQMKDFKTRDTIILIAEAIIKLNREMHKPNNKPGEGMKKEEFIKSLKSLCDECGFEHTLLTEIYDRINVKELCPRVDHVTQVLKVEQTIVDKGLYLALPHRRLVCYCRLFEVEDPAKKQKKDRHQREVFLFNDIVLVTKIFSKKKLGIKYAVKQTFPLCGMQIFMFETLHYLHGIRLTQSLKEGDTLITFNARNDNDRAKFVGDLKEAILESDEMQQYRIEEDFLKHSSEYELDIPDAHVLSRWNSWGSLDSGIASLASSSSLSTYGSKESLLSKKSVFRLADKSASLHVSTLSLPETDQNKEF